MSDRHTHAERMPGMDPYELAAAELLDLHARLDRETAPALDALISTHRQVLDMVSDPIAAAELLRAMADTDPAQVAALLTVAVMRLAARPGED